MRRPGLHTRPGGWRGSPAAIAIGRATLRKWNAKRHLLPKCGAARKRDGQPCQNLALENGRCRYHGGKTGRGDQWHRHVWPDGKSAAATEKLNRKLTDIDRAATKRKKRMKRMSLEERAAYEQWQRDHRPGSAAQRESRRRKRKADAELRKLASAPPKPPSPEVLALQAEIDAAKARLAEMQIQNAKGVFE
ncbi:HGGxSTG domain-containing protein [Mesorhizobium sp. B2-3-4]|uniref:HGGxSTG domain-containing protein n=1 Tax=Mesorhizobium sp. B2-3-4 TaxID=2589959 RepID=UPI00112D34FB|nr:HGGxSTG domain-containing protein [Mesorhizobium sp. B2-3-4]TPM31456.1 hypothetical protein FJ967_24765 [Mesorhizobium sp. B2-3-4]